VTGVVYEQNDQTNLMERWAKRAGLKDIRVFLTTHPNKSKFYLVVEGNEPIYESQQMEDIGVWMVIYKKSLE
jgi:septal ring-binding cell division protein DamX